MGRHLPAGWYVDPADESRYRWWEGDQWSTHTRDKAEVEASIDPALRPLPDFDAEPRPAAGGGDGRRRIPVLLAVALLVGMVATAGIVAFRPQGPGGNRLEGAVRVQLRADPAGRVDTEFLGDGSPCGGNRAGVGRGSRVLVTNARGEPLGHADLEAGVVDRNLASVSCVFLFTIDGVDDAGAYVLKVDREKVRRISRDAIEADDWTVSLRID